jgi:hypothetical protein
MATSLFFLCAMVLTGRVSLRKDNDRIEGSSLGWRIRGGLRPRVKVVKGHYLGEFVLYDPSAEWKRSSTYFDICVRGSVSRGWATTYVVNGGVFEYLPV